MALDLADARRLADAHSIASAPEYLREILRVLIALHDSKPEPVAPIVADTDKPHKGRR